MTTIRLGVLHPTGTATDARSTGSVEWVPSARRVVGADVILPDAFRVTLSATADVTVAVAPTTTAWVWRVLERVSGGSGGWRYLAVPDSAEVVDYAALVEVDPATLVPMGPPPADVWALALAEAAEGLIGPAGVVAATAPVTYDSGTQTVGVTVGTTSGTLAAGDDSRITGAATAANLATEASTARNASNLTLGTVADARLPATAQAATLTSTFARGLSITAGASPATVGAANNATAIQARIDAQAAAGGGMVFIPAGLWLTGPLALKTCVKLVGEGWNSVLKLVNGANTNFITLATIQTEQVGIENLRLDCNKANQTSGNGIHLDNTGYNNALAFPSLGDPNHYVRRVMVHDAKGHGVYTAGAYSQSQFDAVFCYLSDLNNFRIASPDNHLLNCISAKSGVEGFYIASNSNRFVNCKAWGSGRVTATTGAGFVVSAVSRIDLVGCEAQDNRQHGYAFNTTAQLAMSGCRAERNGLGASGTGGVGDGAYFWNVTNSRIDLVCGDSNNGGLKQRWAYNCDAGNAGNIVTLTAGAGQDASQGGIGSFGSTSVGWVRWLGTNAAGAFA